MERICCITSIVSHYKVSIFYWDLISTFLRNCSSIWSNIIFLECKTIVSIAWLNSSCLGFIITNISCIIYKFYSFSWKPNNSLNKRNIFPRRDKYDYISPFKSSKSLRNLFHNDPVSWFKTWSHTIPYNSIWSSYKKPNKQNDSKHKNQEYNKIKRFKSDFFHFSQKVCHMNNAIIMYKIFLKLRGF